MQGLGRNNLSRLQRLGSRSIIEKTLERSKIGHERKEMDAEEQNAVIRGVAIVFACGRRTRGGAQGEMRSGERVSRRGVRAGTFCTWGANENIRNSSRAAPNPRTHPRVTHANPAVTHANARATDTTSEPSMGDFDYAARGAAMQGDESL